MSENSDSLTPLQTWNISRSLISDIDNKGLSKKDADALVSESSLACNQLPEKVYSAISDGINSDTINEAARSLIGEHDKVKNSDQPEDNEKESGSAAERIPLAETQTYGIGAEQEFGWNDARSLAADLRENPSRTEREPVRDSSDLSVSDTEWDEIKNVTSSLLNSQCPESKVTGEIARYLLGNEFKTEAASSATILEGNNQKSRASPSSTESTDNKTGQEESHLETQSDADKSSIDGGESHNDDSDTPSDSQENLNTAASRGSGKSFIETNTVSRNLANGNGEFSAADILQTYTPTDEFEEAASLLIRGFNLHDSSLDYGTIQRLSDITIDWPPRHVILMKTKEYKGSNQRKSVRELSKWLRGIKKETDEIQWEPAPYRLKHRKSR